MAETTTTPTDAQLKTQALSIFKQLENQRNQAINQKDTAKAEALFKQQMALAIKVGLLEDGQKVQADMMKVAPDLRKKFAEYLIDGGKKSQDGMLELLKAANDKKQAMLQDEIDRMYQARLSTADGPAKLLTSFKGFALLLQAFGCDTSEFVSECDRMINEEYAKVPKKDIGRLGKELADKGGFTIDPSPTAQGLRNMQAEAEAAANQIPGIAKKSLQDVITESTSILGGAPTQGQTPSTGQTAPQAQGQPPVAKNYVVSALEQIVQEKKLITSDAKAFAKFKTELLAGVDAAAGVDGDKKSISAKDMQVLTLNTQEALNNNGSKVDATKAAEITRLAIERAKGLALAGAPAPAPG